VRTLAFFWTVLAAATCLACGAGWLTGTELPLPRSRTPEISSSELRHHVEVLASPATEGRLTGSRGERLATDYVARGFRELGLEPAGDDGSYFQQFSFTAGVTLGPKNRLSARLRANEVDLQFEADREWRPLTFSRVGAVPMAEVVYAGYGIVAPQREDQIAIDSYRGLDVEGRWVMVFRYLPEALPGEARRHLQRYAGIRYKAMVARDRGAAGLLVVSGPNSKVRNQLAELRFDGAIAGSSIATLSIADSVAASLLESSNRSLQELQDRADRAHEVDGFVLPSARLEAEIDLHTIRRRGRNVLARLPGSSGPPSIALGAHIDHLGRGEGSNSLAHPSEEGSIHYGADDNASGVAALLEIAQWLASSPHSGEGRRDILFAAWSGEELGLLGSQHFVEQIKFPGAQHAADPHGPQPAPLRLADSIAAYLNMDMVGRLDDSVTLYGVGSSSRWPELIAEFERPEVLKSSSVDDNYLPTDATLFYSDGVPSLTAFTGAHEDYHRPSDLPDRLNYPGLRAIAQLMAEIAASLAADEQPPDYIVSGNPPKRAERSGIRVYLGTIPDYSHAAANGLLLSGVANGGPAELAGLRAGDRVVEVAGRRVDNIYDYTYALDTLRPGVEAQITVLRSGERLSFTLLPQSRD
jgi:hypothetical protein